MEVSIHFGSKKFHTRKIDKTTNAFWIIPYFHMTQNFSIPANHILLTRIKSTYTTSHQIWSQGLSVNLDSTPFFLIFWHVPIPPIFWIPCYGHYLFADTFFKYFSLFESIAAVLTYDMNKSLTFISIETKLIKFINIKIYSKNAHFTTRKGDITKIVMKNRTLPSLDKAL